MQKTESEIKGRGTQNRLNREIKQVNTGKNDIKYIMIWYWKTETQGLK